MLLREETSPMVLRIHVEVNKEKKKRIMNVRTENENYMSYQDLPRPVTRGLGGGGGGFFVGGGGGGVENSVRCWKCVRKCRGESQAGKTTLHQPTKRGRSHEHR